MRIIITRITAYNNIIGVNFSNNTLSKIKKPLDIVPMEGTIAVTHSGNVNYGFLDNTITFSNPNPALNEIITCTSTVKNTGTTSDTFKVSFAQQGLPRSTRARVQSSAPGATVVVTTQFQCLASITICTDAVSTLAIYPVDQSRTVSPVLD